jgi:hypothetical protein
MSSRTSPGPATLRHLDALIGTLRRAGCTVAMAAHALSVIGSYIYGFALQEATLPGYRCRGRRTDPRAVPLDGYPHLTGLTIEHVLVPGYDYGAEFEFGLDLILGGLDRTMLVASDA